MPAAPTRSALFVDFDNIYSGLRVLDPQAAEAFATDPSRWVGWLARRGDSTAAPSRRFLLQVCYLNPSVYSRYRVFFLRAGFRVVDCPSLTAQGKSSADISLALDVLDALAHPTRFDEFVLATADADFTPLLTRLRTHDRRTTVLTAGPASAAYRAVCDEVVLPDAFADAVLGVEAAPVPPDSVAAAAQAVRDAVRAAPGPLAGSSAAQAALAASPDIADGWAGCKRFSVFVSTHVPQLRWAAGATPGYLYDPSRHSEADVAVRPVRALAPHEVLRAQIARVTGTPNLSAQQYAVLFEELAAAAQDTERTRSERARAVRDRTAERGAPVSRAAVNVVVQALTANGQGWEAGATPRGLATAFAESVWALCRSAQMELDDTDVKAIDSWITGALPA